MAVDSLQKNQNSPTQVSYLKYAATGALGGYALKYLVPVTYSERDEDYNAILKENQENAAKQKTDEIEKIRHSGRHSAKRTESTDTFIRMYDGNTLTPENIHKLESPLKENVLNMLNKLNSQSQELITKGKRNLDAVTKSIRPTHVFAGTGLIIGFLTAVGTNILRRIDYFNAQYPSNTELD